MNTEQTVDALAHIVQASEQTKNWRELSCKERWTSCKRGRIADLRRLIKAYQAGEDSAYYKQVHNELGDLNEYGLCFDYVQRLDLGKWQKRGFWRYQLSWGGPSDEFRFYADSPDQTVPDRIEYAFLDWFDGCARALRGKDFELLVDWWRDMVDCGVPAEQYRKVMED